MRTLRNATPVSSGDSTHGQKKCSTYSHLAPLRCCLDLNSTDARRMMVGTGSYGSDGRYDSTKKVANTGE